MITTTGIKEACSLLRNSRFHEVEQVVDFLKIHGKRIGERARQGEHDAEELVSWYEFCYRAPGDPGGQMLLVLSMNEYYDKHGEELEAELL